MNQSKSDSHSSSSPDGFLVLFERGLPGDSERVAGVRYQFVRQSPVPSAVSRLAAHDGRDEPAAQCPAGSPQYCGRSAFVDASVCSMNVGLESV